MPSEPHAGPPWTILKLLRWTTAYFQDCVPENPRMDAEIMLAHTLGCRRLDLYLHHDQPLDENELTRFRDLVKRRANREPTAYILGYKEFWSLQLKVTRDVLIPRPDTECLVETVLQTLAAQQFAGRDRLLELGVGSGAISMALAKEKPDLNIIAGDISPSAVAVAHHNARQHHLDHQIQFFAGNWMGPLKRSTDLFDLIVSNPPYIAFSDLSQLAPEITNHEPVQALDGGPDGMQCITVLIQTASDYLKPGGCLILEMGYDQKSLVEIVAHGCTQYDEVFFQKDYAGHHRVVRLRKGCNP